MCLHLRFILVMAVVMTGSQADGDEKPEVKKAGPAAASDAELKALVEGNNEFAVALYKRLAAKSDGNVLVSPYSISSALAMTYAGARGKTAEEMAKVLGLTGLAGRAHPAHAALARRLRGDGGKGGPEFHTANALWGQRGLPFRDGFVRLTRDHYGAGLREIDFTEPDAARQTINRWVADQTREKIPDLLKPSDLDAGSKLVLTNAIYFRADWARPFDIKDTKHGPFHRTPTDRVTVPFMRQTVALRYAEADGVRVVEIPYAGHDYSMALVLPTRAEDAGRIPTRLAGGGLEGWLAKANKREVVLTLPKVVLRAKAELGPVLERLGMPTAFSDRADFSGVSPGRTPPISRVVHEAVAALDERGTEAAAATAVVLGDVKAQPMEFRADRPFHFVIRHTRSQTVLFIGRLSDPSGS